MVVFVGVGLGGPGGQGLNDGVTVGVTVGVGVVVGVVVTVGVGVGVGNGTFKIEGQSAPSINMV